LDADVIVLKSFDPLRSFHTVMGRETVNGLCNGILISVKNSLFIRMLLEQYNNYTGENEAWAYRSVYFPHILAQRHPSWIHVEETSLHRPNWMERDQIYGKTMYDWKNNYSIHLWVRLQNGVNVPQSVADIDCTNTTIAQIARHAYYGSKQLRCGLNTTLIL